MNKETLKSIMRFLEKEDNKSSVKWKLLNKEPFTEDDLYVNGNLNLFGSEIKSLPEGLKVEDNLFLNDCKNLTSLPEGLKVGENLYIRNTLLKNYSDEELREMIKTGFIGGKIL